jgi:hypothetical protein
MVLQDGIDYRPSGPHGVFAGKLGAVAGNDVAEESFNVADMAKNIADAWSAVISLVILS